MTDLHEPWASQTTESHGLYWSWHLARCSEIRQHTLLMALK